MKYLNKKTGIIFETDCILQGENIEPVEAQAKEEKPKPKATKKK